MAQTRHEEYTSYQKMPFVFRSRIVRYAAHQTRPANWHENIEVQLCLEGEGFFLLDGKRCPITEGDIAVANSNSIHFTGTDDKIVYSVIIIDTEFCRDADINYTKLAFDSVFKDRKIADIFEKVSEEINNADDPCHIARLKMLCLELLIQLRENHTVNERVAPAEKLVFTTVKNAMEYIHKNYAAHFTLDDIAAALFVDKYNLARSFKECTGSTIVKHTNSYRCEKAKVMIIEGMPVHDAARACGFNNMSFFTKTFKEYIGKMPSEYKPSKR